MFKKILNILKQPELLTKSIDDSKMILRISRKMYFIANEAFLSGNDPEEDIEQLDEQINRQQMQIKRKILEYLNSEPAMDIYAALMIINIVTNVERLGDYSKNIYQLTHLPATEWKTMFLDTARGFYKEVGNLYEGTAIAYINSDKEKAREMLSAFSHISGKCRDFLISLASAQDTDGKYVVITLYIRYMKRIASHLLHIAQSVENPFNFNRLES